MDKATLIQQTKAAMIADIMPLYEHDQHDVTPCFSVEEENDRIIVTLRVMNDGECLAKTERKLQQLNG